ncbi:MAG: ABC transporter substrate-binding protein [Alphaproteobacteria bacterium]|nr:ABC transporter substrate-binding protein [Alphaproteobacteria bacterium]MCW5743614.1 ABC transporter substrate-binding protein [Alphaproteobacteria bacterium]
MRTILAAALALSFAGVTAEAQTLRVRLNSDIRSTDPGSNLRDENTDTVVQHMVEGLVAFRENAAVGMLLAEKVDVSQDGKTYTFTLRQGVRFHNGATLTSEDVVWSWKRYLGADSRWRCKPELSGGVAKIEDISAKDPRTVVFTIDRPSALFLVTMARPDCGGSAILHKDSLDADGKWKAPVGTGPFRFGEWKRDQYIELVRFDGYSRREGPRDGFTGGKVAMVERVRFNIIPDASAGRAALISGSIDFTGFSTSEYDDIKIRKEVKVSVGPSMAFAAILFQVKDPVLKDARVRRAIALSIDTAEIANAVTFGLAKPNNSPVAPSSPWYSKTLATSFKRDVAQARKLLAEAGYKGETIKLIANKRYAYMFDAAVLVQAMAAEAGIKIDVEVQDWASQLDRYTKGDYQAMSFGYSARLDPALSYEVFSGPKATQPRKVWDDPRVEELVRESMRTGDAARRQAIFDELHKKLLEDVPLIALFNPVETGAVRANVEGYAGWPAGFARFWGVTLK